MKPVLFTVCCDGFAYPDFVKCSTLDNLFHCWLCLLLFLNAGLLKLLKCANLLSVV